MTRVLLVAVPHLDWRLALRLVDEGAMPRLAAMVEGGAIGKLRPVSPEGAATQMTSIATGRFADRHGILCGLDFAGDEGLRPVDDRSRVARSLWEVLQAQGLRTQAFGWPACAPADRGVGVTERYPRNPGPDEATGDAALKESLAELAFTAADLSPLDLQFYLGDEALPPRADDARLAVLANVIAETATLHAAATECLETRPWDFAAVHYAGLGKLTEVFAAFHPPRPEFVPQDDFARWRHVLRAAYVMQDMMLGRLREICGPETAVMVVSPSGARLGADRSPIGPTEPGAPGLPDLPGMFVAAGPGFRRDELAFGASVLDVFPTMTRLFGLPTARDLPGAALERALDTSGSDAEIDSWEDDPKAPRAAVRARLSAPLPPPSRDLADLQRRAVAEERRFAYALSCQSHGELDEAVEMLQRLVDEAPEESRSSNQLITCHLMRGDAAAARVAFERMFRDKKRMLPAALAELRELDARCAGTLSPAERERRNRLWKRTRTNVSGMAFLQAWIAYVDGRPAETLRILAGADETRVHNRAGFVKLRAMALTRMGRRREAEAEWRRLVDLDPDQPDGHLGLAKLRFAQREYASAAEHALDSVRRRFFNPEGHFLYGVSIFRCGRPDLALRALQTTVTQAPGHVGALRRLAMIHRHGLNDPVAADAYDLRAAAASGDALQTEEAEMTVAINEPAR